jgi:hypothetical protein
MKNLAKLHEVKRLVDLEATLQAERIRTYNTRVQLQQELVAEEHGLTPGETLVKRKSSGKVYRFYKADVNWFSLVNINVPWILGFRQLKNGDFGKRAESLYTDWEKI